MQKTAFRATRSPKTITGLMKKRSSPVHFLGFEHFFENARSRPTLPPRNQKLFSAALFLRVGAASIGLRPSVHRARRGDADAGDCQDGPKMAPRWPQDGPKTRGGHAHSRAKRFDDRIKIKSGCRDGPTRRAPCAVLRRGEMTRRPEAADRGMRCVLFIS